MSFSTLFTSECYVILLTITVHCKVVKYDVWCATHWKWCHSHIFFFIYITYLLMMSSVMIF